MSFRSKPVGWRGESHRHYLAAKGVKTRHKYFQPSDVQLLEYVEAGVKPFAFVNPKLKEQALAAGLKVREDSDRRQLIVGKEDPREFPEDFDTHVIGRMLGYPESAIEGHGVRESMKLSNEELFESNDAINKNLLRAGISADDLEYLEFIPFNMSPDEVRVEIEERKFATDSLPDQSSTLRELERQVYKEMIGRKLTKSDFAERLKELDEVKPVKK